MTKRMASKKINKNSLMDKAQLEGLKKNRQS